jgi:hypothetical protein
MLPAAQPVLAADTAAGAVEADAKAAAPAPEVSIQP